MDNRKLELLAVNLLNVNYATKAKLELELVKNRLMMQNFLALRSEDPEHKNAALRESTHQISKLCKDCEKGIDFLQKYMLFVTEVACSEAQAKRKEDTDGEKTENKDQ